MPQPAEWRYDATTQPWLRALLLVGAGTLYGFWGLLLTGMATVFGLVLWRGSTEVRLLVLLLALIGGPFSLVYLWPMLSDPSQRPRFYPESVERVLSTREKLAIGAVGTAVLAAAAWAGQWFVGGLVALGVAAGLAYLLVRTRGSIDPASATATSGPREWDLSRVTGYRTHRLGPLVLVSLETASGPARLGGFPSHLSVPARDVPAATDALAAIVADNDERGTTGRDPNPQVRWAAGGLGVLLGGIGLGGVALVGGPVGWYLAALCWLFAALFVFVAREG